MGILLIVSSFSTVKYNKLQSTANPNYNQSTATSFSVTSEAPTEQLSFMQKININTATLEELMTLKSIGQVKATAIIEYREANGGFMILEELLYVDGITDKIFAENLGRITI